MNVPSDPRPDPRADWLAALAWQVELGADEAIGETPVDRFSEAVAPGGTAAAPSLPSPTRGEGGVGGEVARGPWSVAQPARAISGRGEPAEVTRAPSPLVGEGRGGGTDLQDARALAEVAETLEELAGAMRGWAGSPLREAARNLVFCDGLAGARLMVIGEAPGADEDRVGKPFVGKAGRLLDRMLAAIGLSRTAPAPESAVYITNILPWRPPGNRTPSEAEARQFLPFVERHIVLAKPDLVLTLGNTPTKALLGTMTGIKRMRGSWARHEATGLVIMPTFHPAYLLRTPEDKRLAWRDLLAVRRALDGEAPRI